MSYHAYNHRNFGIDPADPQYDSSCEYEPEDAAAEAAAWEEMYAEDNRYGEY